MLTAPRLRVVRRCAWTARRRRLRALYCVGELGAGQRGMSVVGVCVRSTQVVECVAVCVVCCVPCVDRTRALGGLCGTQPGVGTLRALSYGAGLKIFNDERLTIIQYVYARGATLLPASSHTYLCRHAMRMDWPLNSRCATQKQQNGVPPNRHPRHHATRHLMACSVATMIPQSAKAAP